MPMTPGTYSDTKGIVPGKGPHGPMPVASNQENAFAVRLLVEQLVGLLRLVERPAVREQLVDIDLALDAERARTRPG